MQSKQHQFVIATSAHRAE